MGKKKKFEVDFAITFEGRVQIEAKDDEEAEELVRNMDMKKLMDLAEISLDDGSLSVDGVEEEEEE